LFVADWGIADFISLTCCIVSSCKLGVANVKGRVAA
jgi:hypothetical protein